MLGVGLGSTGEASCMQLENFYMHLTAFNTRWSMMRHVTAERGEHDGSRNQVIRVRGGMP